MAAISGLIAAGVGAAGAIGGAAMSSSAAKSAANAQAAAQQQATQFQKDALQQTRIDSAPWMYAGQTALYQLMDGLGLSRPQNPIFYDPNSGPIGSAYAQGSNQNALGRDGAFQTGGIANTPAGQTSNATSAWGGPMTQGAGFTQTPGYQFQVQQANDAVQNRMAALGMAGSGDAMKALATTTNGLAAQEYGNYLNRLASMAGMGQTQTSQTNAATMGAAGNMSNIAMAGGQNRASSIMSGANSWNTALGYLTNPNGPVMNAFSQQNWGGQTPQFQGFSGDTGYSSGIMSGLSL
jgi:hypothetical protein